MLKRLPSFFKNPYFILFAFIFIANIISVFGLDILWTDDNHVYLYAIKKEIMWGRARRAFLYPIVMQPFYLLLPVSNVLAKFALLLFTFVPTSALFYYICVNFFGLDSWVAILAAILPNIAPAQYQVFTHVDAGYHVLGLAVAWLTIIMGFKFISAQRLNRESLLHAFIAVGLYGINCQIMGQSIFILPAMAVLFFLFRKIDARKVFAFLGMFALLAIQKIYMMVTHPWGSEKEIVPTLPITIERSIQSLQAFSPFYFIENNVLGYLIALSMLVVAALVLMRAKKNKIEGEVFKHDTSSARSRFWAINLFALVWMIGASAPFVLISSSFSLRHVHIAAFGFSLIFSMVIALIFSMMKIKKHFAAFCIILMVVLSGIKIYVSKASYDPVNLANKNFKEAIHQIPIVPNTQIVVLGNVGIPTGGWWQWSSGYLKYITKDPGIEGLMSEEFFYYDPFNLDERGFYRQMTGLEPNKKTYVYRFDDVKNTLTPERFGLRWHPDTTWELLDFSDQREGKPLIYKKGKGMEEFKKVSLEVKHTFNRGIVWSK